MSEQESQSEKKPDPKKAEDLESGDLEGISSELENLLKSRDLCKQLCLCNGFLHLWFHRY